MLKFFRTCIIRYSVTSGHLFSSMTKDQFYFCITMTCLIFLSEGNAVALKVSCNYPNSVYSLDNDLLSITLAALAKSHLPLSYTKVHYIKIT